LSSSICATKCIFSFFYISGNCLFAVPGVSEFASTVCYLLYA